MDGQGRGRARARKGTAPRPGRAPAGRPQNHRRWIWRTFLLGIALGLVWAGWNHAMADLRTIRQLFGF